MSEKNATNKNSAYHAYLILGLKAEKEHVRDIKSSRAARGIPVFQGGTVLDNSGKKQVRWITVNQTTAPERPYITRSVSHWDNNRDRINTITKKRRGRRAGLEIKMQEKIK